MNLLKTKSIYYDDVNLISQPNYILTSRREVPQELHRIFVSPMSSIIGESFAIQAYNLGLSMVLHRFSSKENQLKIFQKINPKEKDRVFCSIGLNDFDHYNYLKDNGVTCFCIDVANAYLKSVVDFTDKIFEKNSTNLTMIGNIHSREGIKLYKDYPGIICRIGIGNGSACDTATKATGFGRGQITELEETIDEASYYGINICADGGIKNGACAVKAFGLGSDYIMLGGYWKTAKEAQNVIDKEFKFWGSASKLNQKKCGEIRRHSEGKVLEVNQEEIEPLETLVNDLWGGISSGVSYGGYNNLSQFIGNGVFEIKNN